MNLYPSRDDAEKTIKEAAQTNPTKWVPHSYFTAKAAEIIAAATTTIDPGKAYIFGLLHDIGRYEGVTGERHIINGYRFCMKKGWDDCARICMTHTFVLKDMRCALGGWDMPMEDKAFIEQYVLTTQYNDYDLLIQLCDCLALPSGFCILEKRLVDVIRRYGANEKTQDRLNKSFEILNYFDIMVGGSVYSLLGLAG